MDIPWSPVQRRRLEELQAAAELDRLFSGEAERDAAFQELEKRLVKAGRAELAALQAAARPPGLCRLEACLSDLLAGAGFTRVLTPTLMSRGMLARMGIRLGHPLHEKIFWVDERRCLRPMLAPTCTRCWWTCRSGKAGAHFRGGSASAETRRGTRPSSPCSTCARWACRPTAAAPAWKSWPRC
jgi:phenylalanyl-tRNA synthetase alpha chain